MDDDYQRLFAMLSCLRESEIDVLIQFCLVTNAELFGIHKGIKMRKRYALNLAQDPTPAPAPQREQAPIDLETLGDSTSTTTNNVTARRPVLTEGVLSLRHSSTWPEMSPSSDVRLI